MRFLVVSDTHGDSRNLAAVLSKLGRHVDGIIHCGDGVADLGAASHSGAPMPPAYPVRGNADANFSLPQTRIVCAFDKRILVVHGHHFLHTSSLSMLQDEAGRNQANACFFGHTHIPLCHAGPKVLLMNPGSLSKPRSSWGPSFAVVEIPQDGMGAFDVKFYELKGTAAKPRFHAFRPY